MYRKRLLATVALTAAILLSACSSSPAPTAPAEAEAKKEAPKAPEAVPAQVAYYEMYKPARTWAPDAIGLTLTSGEVPGIKNEDGKAGLWTAIFVSPSRKEARTFRYAVVEDKSADLLKGMNIGGPQVWTGATPTSKVFANSEFLVNSDAAFKSASEKAASWLKTHPNVKYTMALGNTSRFPAPVWYIMWGTKSDGYAVYVNATSGLVVTQ